VIGIEPRTVLARRAVEKTSDRAEDEAQERPFAEERAGIVATAKALSTAT
jgi:hypothetical protein